MAPSNSLLDNRLFNNLIVNRLSAQKIRSNNVESLTPSYLFSAVFNNAVFTRTLTGGILTLNITDIESVIKFSDRPFRLTDYILPNEFISYFLTNNFGTNTFSEDPPNAVLSHNEEQRTYIIRLALRNLDSVTFNLDLIPGERHNLNDINGRMSFFVDSVDSVEFTLSYLEKRLYKNKKLQLVSKYHNLTIDKIIDNNKMEISSLEFSYKYKNYNFKNGDNLKFIQYIPQNLQGTNITASEIQKTSAGIVIMNNNDNQVYSVYSKTFINSHSIDAMLYSNNSIKIFIGWKITYIIQLQ